MLKTILTKLPISLIILRLLSGFLMIFLSLRHVDYSTVIFYLIIFGFLTDFFDGFIARLLKISTQFLCRFDTIVDRIFWLSVLFAVWRLSTGFIQTKYREIGLVLTLEAVNYLISFIRFKKEISTHAILSKLWAVSLLVAFCDLVLNGSSRYLFDIMIILGIISRLDTGLIMLILPKWDHDIPTFYHAILIRKGKKIKRYKLFNG